MHRDRTVILQGQRFHYAEWGEAAAPALIMLHGVTGHARTWDEEAGAFASRYRVLALDQRGHGDSDPPSDGDYTVAAMAGDLTAFADTLGLARVAIVGLSMGGRVAIAFAGQHQSRMDRLVVVDIGPDISAAGRLRVRALLAPAPQLLPSPRQAPPFHPGARPPSHPGASPPPRPLRTQPGPRRPPSEKGL